MNDILSLTANPAQQVDRVPLEYANAVALYLAARRGEREFILRYHDNEARQITGIGLGSGCVWVEAGNMLPVHIYADGSSKDGPMIWLEAADQSFGASSENT